MYGHHSPGCSVRTRRRSGWRSKTPAKINRCAARRLNHPPLSIDINAVSSGPWNTAGSPAPECVVNGMASSSAAAQSGSHARSL